ncbi:hypothetical protein [Nitrobacter sp. TKz-YC02]|uniref:hypothetical protein n=1 Tax=Nitrobacter sp. TKz-YC02 TaxID=3398704 RepID=UPI003CE7D10A
MPDENLMSDVDAFANKGMRLNFTEAPDRYPRLNFNKGANEGVIPNGAPIKVHQIRERNPRPLSQLNVGCDGQTMLPLRPSDAKLAKLGQPNTMRRVEPTTMFHFCSNDISQSVVEGEAKVVKL